MILSVYRGLSYAAAPVLRRFLERRKQRGKEDPIRIEERFGNPVSYTHLTLPTTPYV